jgi:hypothetical protein
MEPDFISAGVSQHHEQPRPENVIWTPTGAGGGIFSAEGDITYRAYQLCRLEYGLYREEASW